MACGTFRYFLPGAALNAQNRVDQALLEERGLWDRLDDVVTGQLATDKYSVDPIQGGPDGLDGLLIVPQPHDDAIVADLGFDGGQQDWSRSLAGDYWIGVDRRHPPTPAGLARRTIVSGYEHTLGDGQTWTCPTLRTEILQPRVPMTYGMLGDEAFGRVLPHYRDVWQASQQWCVLFLDDYQHHKIVEVFGVADAITAAVSCLAVNYRLGTEEATLIELFDDDALELVIHAAIDMPAFRAIHLPGGDQKKRASWRELLDDWRNSLRGSGADTPDSQPPAPTSN